MRSDTLQILGVIGLACGMAFADGVPPVGSVSLASLLQSVEKQGYQAITEVSFDDGEWEIEALQGTNPVGLRITPQSGDIRHVHADEPHPVLPQKALSAAQVLDTLQKAGYPTITKIELEPNGWEAEALQNGIEHELLLDLTTGKILVDQIDN